MNIVDVLELRGRRGVDEFAAEDEVQTLGHGANSVVGSG
jgi:hypothetical protein